MSVSACGGPTPELSEGGGGPLLWLLGARRPAPVGALLLVALCVASCGSPPVIYGKVMKRVPSPNGSSTAMITRSDAGATTPYSYHVYIVSRADRWPAEVLRADHQQGLALRWDDEDNLTIHMDCGRIFTYLNFDDVIDRRHGSLLRTITVHLDNGGLCPGQR